VSKVPKPKVKCIQRQYTTEQLTDIRIFSQRDWDRFIALLEFLERLR
jgi:hypothetical protein